MVGNNLGQSGFANTRWPPENHRRYSVFVNEPTVIDICSKALVTVVQLMGAQNTSNRFYAVHPRRNDRFLARKEFGAVSAVSTLENPGSSLL